MAEHEAIKLFESLRVRVVWDDVQEKYFFSIVDVVAVLTDQATARSASTYWAVLKKRLSTEGANEMLTNCKQLKKAEPFKQWLAQVGAERIRQMQDPERSIEQMVRDYRRLGYSENWINQRIKTIEIRKGLTDEWKRSGIEHESEYARLTDLMSKIWSGMTTREYKEHKGLTDQNLRDNMTNMELLLNALAEQTATDLSKERNPEGLIEAAHVAKDGAEVARNAREDIEQRLGHSVISDKTAIDYITPDDELPFKK